MKCKNCGAEIKNDLRYCPECGEPLDTPEEEYAPAEDAAEETPAETPAAEDAAAPAAPDAAPAEAAPQPPAPKKRGSAGLIAIILAVAVVLTLCGGLFFALRGRSAGDKEEPAATTEDSGAALTDTDPAPTADAVVATYGDHELTNELFLFYYWDEFYYLYNQYGSSITSVLDPSQSFATQEYQDGQSWRAHFTENALTAWVQTMALCDEAEKAGFALSAADQTELDGIGDKLTSYAAQNNLADGEAYLRANYDACVTLAGFQEYLQGTYLASGYVNSIHQGFMDDHADLADQVKYNVQVRHILIKPAEDTDAAKAAAKTEAERIYALWQQNPTEDNFAALAAQYSGDDGSKDNGGLYDDVSPDQMVTEFNDWCFDESRKVGDTGLVQTQFGWHIMYFSGYSENYYESAQETAAGEDYSAWIDPILAKAEYVRTDAKIGFSR